MAHIAGGRLFFNNFTIIIVYSLCHTSHKLLDEKPEISSQSPRGNKTEGDKRKARDEEKNDLIKVIIIHEQRAMSNDAVQSIEMRSKLQ